jgi:predicted AAA+ superfamily ATPase
MKMPLFWNGFRKSCQLFGMDSEKVVLLYKITFMITRLLDQTIHKRIGQGKAIIIMGPRQVGKTTLLKNLKYDADEVLWLNGDETDVQQLFSEMSASRLSAILGKKKILIIDEAQRIENIGLRIKLVTDTLKDIQVFASGSSSFELANKIKEPLTGRKWEFNMYPVSFAEMVNHHGLLEEKRLMPHRLVYGYYPEIVTNPGDEKDRLKLISESYLYKDILSWENIQKPDKLNKLLQALAFQVGSLVSYHELGQLCGIDSKTVEKYISLLEKSFIIFKLNSFSRNLRNELNSSKKIYFYDNGIRNAVIANFNQIENRTDIGPLWENFLMSERMKYNSYRQIWNNSYFWRTKEQQEIDYLEEENGQIKVFEFKWNANKKAKIPTAFANAYPNAEFAVINKDNFETFLYDF